MEMKKVLMIAEYFAPAGGIGSLRVIKFVKYLRKFGWEPVVLTVREDCYPRNVWLDFNLMKDIPEDIYIYRTKIWRSRIINDEGIRWLPFILTTLSKIVREEHPNLIYLTGGPFFSLISGPFIKFLFRLPYVVDLRDPWKLVRRKVGNRGLKNRLGKLLIDIAEPIVIRYAAKVICVSEQMCQEYRKAYSNLPTEKFTVVTNGYEPDDFVDVIPKHFTNFTIVYTGKFRTSIGFRDPESFFKALKLLRERGRECYFIHVGRLEEEIKSLAEKIGISDLIKFVGACSYYESLAYSKGADLLLLIGTGQNIEQTGKIFDYIGCGKPILALAPENGEIAKIAKEISSIRLVPNRNVNAIALAIEEVQAKTRKSHVTTYLHNNRIKVSYQKPIQKYSRKYLTGVLAKVFDECSK